MPLFGSKGDSGGLRPDIAAARAAITNKGTVGISKAVDNLESLLAPGETVTAMTVANRGGPAILVVTDRRVLLSWHHVGNKSQTEVQLSQITAVNFESKWGATRSGALLIGTAGGALNAEGIFGKEGERIVTAIRRQMAAGSAPAGPATPPQSAASASPPPPPGVPAGWYLDSAAEVQRYWDGSGWTEHTAPMPSD